MATHLDQTWHMKYTLIAKCHRLSFVPRWLSILARPTLHLFMTTQTNTHRLWMWLIPLLFANLCISPIFSTDSLIMSYLSCYSRHRNTHMQPHNLSRLSHPPLFDDLVLSFSLSLSLWVSCSMVSSRSLSISVYRLHCSYSHTSLRFGYIQTLLSTPTVLIMTRREYYRQLHTHIYISAWIHANTQESTHSSVFRICMKPLLVLDFALSWQLCFTGRTLDQ